MISIKLIITLAASLLIISTGILAPAALAQTTQQKDTVQEEDYPVVIQPTGALPSDVTQIPQEVKRYSKDGTVHIVAVNTKPLLEKSEKYNRIKLWAGDDIGYIAVQKSKLFEHKFKDHPLEEYIYTWSWTGNIIGNKGSIILSFKKDNKAIGTINIHNKSFNIMPLKNSNLHVIYVYNRDKAHKFHCGNDAFIDE